MHTCILLQGLKRSWHSCLRWVNAGNKDTPSMHHPQRQNVTTCMVGLEKKNDHIRKYLTKKYSPQCAANCLQHAHSSGPCAIMCKSHAAHGALITCNMSCAMLYEGTAQLLSLTEFKSHSFKLYSIGWTIILTDEGGWKPEYWEKTPDNQLQKMPHTKARKFQPQ